MKHEKVVVIALIVLVSMLLVYVGNIIGNRNMSKDISVEEPGNQYYGGSYYEDGKFYYCYTDNLEELKTYVPIPCYFTKVKYNVNQLNKGMEEVSKVMGEYGITAAVLSHKENAIIVTLDDLSQIDKINNKVEFDGLIFEQAPKNLNIGF